MLTVGRPNDVTIRRLCARLDSTDFDPLSARLHLERLLANVQISSAWLSPSAILCIRQMPDPRPGALRLLARELRPAVEWERGLRSALEQKVRAAVRPALGAVPPDAEAVVFADRSELIACLALDCSAGTASERWWWAALTRELDLLRAAVVALLDGPEYAPAAFERLTQLGMAASFVTRLTTTDVTRIEATLLERFGLTELARALSSPVLVAQEASRRPTAGATHVAAPERRAQDYSRPEPDAPWSRFIAAFELGMLAPEPRRLLALALSIQRAPLAVRTPEFARSFAAHFQAPAKASPLTATAEPRAPAVPLTTDDAAPPAGVRGSFTNNELSATSASPGRAASTDVLRVDPSVTAVPPSASASATRTPSIKPLIEPSTLAAEVPTARPAEPIAFEAPSAAAAVLVLPETARVAPEPPHPGSNRQSPVDELSRIYGVPTVTNLGGLFYLANLALALELYPDFSRPTDRGASLPIWDFIALVGARLLGDPPADPAWALLQRLAGRAAGEAPTALFAPPSGWQLPTDWAGLVTAPGEPEIGSWLDWLMPLLRERLVRALGLASPDEVAGVLLTYSARVHVTDTHVDVLLSLDELPLAIRRAGLDRDPGWLPAAGRFLAFHFG